MARLRDTREQGQGLAEYGLIILLVALIVFAALLIMGPQVGNMFSSLTAEI